MKRGLPESFLVLTSALHSVARPRIPVGLPIDVLDATLKFEAGAFVLLLFIGPA